MEVVCDQIKSGNTDRDFYKSQLVFVNNLARREWVDQESPLILAVEHNKIEIVEYLIYLGVNVNSVQRQENITKVNTINSKITFKRFKDLIMIFLDALLKQWTTLSLSGDNVITWIGKLSCVHATSLQMRANYFKFCFYG